MKSFASVFLLLLLVCYSSQIPKYENCGENILQLVTAKNCVKVTCYPPGTSFEIRTCDVINCETGTQIGYYTGPPSKEFPECCSNPICK